MQEEINVKIFHFCKNVRRVCVVWVWLCCNVCKCNVIVIVILAVSHQVREIRRVYSLEPYFQIDSLNCEKNL
jgi:hypothetical protein